MTLFCSLEALIDSRNDLNSEICIGMRIAYSATANQCLTFITQLKNFTNIYVCVLVTEKEYYAEKRWYDKEFERFDLVIFSELDDRLSLFDVFICPESNKSLYLELPKNVIKIGLPHGPDVPLDRTVEIYGGGYAFDYILAQVNNGVYDAVRYKNKFFNAFRNHKCNFVCEVPFGNPKLDAMKVAYENEINKERTIIYHLSLMSLEPDWVEGFLPIVLLDLLDSFPHHQVIFRPHHLDRKHPIVEKVIALGSHYRNFLLSIDDSYVKDYSCGALMICHRDYQEHLFPIATGSPLFCVHPDDINHPVSGCGFKVCYSELINKVRLALDGRLIQPFNTGNLYNHGHSVESFVLRLPDILAGRKMVDCDYYELDGSDFNDQKLLPTVSNIVMELLKGRVANLFFMALANYFPHWPLGKILMVESFCRPTALTDYYGEIANRLFIENKKVMSRNQLVYNKWFALRSHLFESQIQSSFYDQDLEFINLVQNSFSQVNDGVVLYGSGDVCEQVLSWLTERHIHVSSIVDSSNLRWGKVIGGVSITSPDSVSKDIKQIIICSYAYIEQIKCTIDDLGFSGELDILAPCPELVTADLIRAVFSEAEQVTNMSKGNF